MRFRCFLAALLSLAMLAACAPGALAAENEASVMRLTKTEGTVDISSSSGKAISMIKNMRLYNGYQLETAEKSYAWVNLDDSKLAKLDAASGASIRKSGKKLEILVDSGNVFFNVSQPLEDDESLNIRTSTMVVGIRGTCGWVEVENEKNARVSILEGSVDVTVTDPVSGQEKSDRISGGETARCVVYEEAAAAGGKCGILREACQKEDVSGFMLTELVPDSPLVEKIYQESGIDLRNVTMEEAGDRLDRDQMETGEKLAAIESVQEAQENKVSTEPAWKDSAPAQTAPDRDRDSGSSDDSGDSGDSGGGTAPSDTIRLSASATAAEINAALARYNGVTVGDGSTSMTLDGAVTVPAGRTLRFDGPEAIAAGAGLTVNGTATASRGLVNNGTLTVNSSNTLNVQGDLVNNGSFTVTATGRTVVNGNLSGSISLSRGAAVLFQSYTGLTLPSGWSVSAQASGGYYTLYQEPEPPEPASYTVTLSTGGIPENPGGGQYRVGYGKDGDFYVWTPGTITVDNGASLGSGLPMNLALAVYAGSGIYDPAPYEFGGWYDNLQGSGTPYTPDTPITKDVTLYAQWVSTVCTVTFDLNGGTWLKGSEHVTDPVTATVDRGQSLPLGDPSDPVSVIAQYFSGEWLDPSGNYGSSSLLGWCANKEGTGAAFDLSAPITGDVILYAKWVPAEVTVTLDLNGGAYDGGSATGIITERSVVLDGGASLVSQGYTNHDLVTTMFFGSSGLSGPVDSLSEIACWKAGTSDADPAFDLSTAITEDITLCACWWDTSGGQNIAFYQDGTTLRIKNAQSGGDANLDAIQFAYKTELASVELLNGVTGIGDQTFEGCTALAEITIPISIKTIGQDAFRVSTGGLRTIRYNGRSDYFLSNVVTPSGCLISDPSDSEAEAPASKSLGIPREAVFVFSDGSFKVNDAGDGFVSA